MYEYTLYNTETHEEAVAFGYFYKDMLQKHPMYNSPEWVLLRADYID